MPGMGPFRGSQAELVRVPFADANCVVLPGIPGDEHEDDFVLIADAWVTGWHATELAGVRAADTVAVFGAGAVGLLAAYSAQLRGASEVYSVDLIGERLDKAAELGFVPIDARQGDPVEQIRELRRVRPGACPPGEEEMAGVMAGIDAVGFQARDRRHPDREDPRQVIDDLVRLVNPTGRLGIAGVFTATDAAPAPQGGHADGSLRVPWAALFNKGVTVGFGRTHDRRYTTHLRDLIISGRARPGQIVTHHEPLENAPAIYDRFDRRADGIIKAVFHH
jgi:glutathione-independent formaldehyde dehydrogenase